MKKLFSPLILASFIFLIGCGERVRVNPGEVGKVLTNSGWKDGIIPQKSFRLDYCGVDACDVLVRLQTAKNTETMTINSLFLPSSNVDLTKVEFSLQMEVKKGPKFINKIFDEIASKKLSNQERLIESGKLFEIYIKRKAPEEVIDVLRNYKIEEIMSYVKTIAEFAKKRVNEAKRELYAIDEQKARDVRSLIAALEVEAIDDPCELTDESMESMFLTKDCGEVKSFKEAIEDHIKEFGNKPRIFTSTEC